MTRSQLTTPVGALVVGLIIVVAPASGARVVQEQQLGAGDAIELCGAANPDVSAWLDASARDSSSPDSAKWCEEDSKGTDRLDVIFTSRGQADRLSSQYQLPPYRLYLCHPGAALQGVLFSGNGKTLIKSPEAMRNVLQKLTTHSLWNLKQTMSETVYRQYKKISGAIKGRAARDMNSIMLWVLDRDGNFVFAPEVQDGQIFKHGDLTPGSKPWSRPTVAKKAEASQCCCGSQEQAACKYSFNLHVDVKLRCCKWRIGGCSKLSAFHEAQSAAFCDVDPADGETYFEGKYRGVARAGGELKFPEGGRPILQDKSGYSFSRISMSQALDDDVEDRLSQQGWLDNVARALRATAGSPLGPCAMSRLKSYWSEKLGLPISELDFAAAEYDAKGDEFMTTV